MVHTIFTFPLVICVRWLFKLYSMLMNYHLSLLLSLLLLLFIDDKFATLAQCVCCCHYFQSGAHNCDLNEKPRSNVECSLLNAFNFIIILLDLYMYILCDCCAVPKSTKWMHFYGIFKAKKWGIIWFNYKIKKTFKQKFNAQSNSRIVVISGEWRYYARFLGS